MSLLPGGASRSASFCVQPSGAFAPVAIENITMQSNAMRAVLFLTSLGNFEGSSYETMDASMQDLGSRGCAGFPTPMPFF
jgi:hypothetical protein